MKKLIIALLVMVAPVTASAEVYKVYVTRIDKDLYRVHGSRLIIQTQYCYHYAYNERAILDYERYSYDNKLIFVDSGAGTHCPVKKVF